MSFFISRTPYSSIKNNISQTKLCFILKTKFFANFSLVVLILSVITIAYSCKSDDVVTPPTGPENNTISGTVYFADTSLGSIAVGYYDIAAFATWPPSGAPTANDSLELVKVGGKYQANYTIKGLGVGVDSAKFVIAVGWRRLTGGASPVMGIFGCDTAHYTPPTSTCPLSPSKITIRNNVGVTSQNMISWADTTKRIF